MKQITLQALMNLWVLTNKCPLSVLLFTPLHKQVNMREYPFL